MRLLILEKSIMEGWKPTLSGWSILSLLCFKPIEPRTGKGWLRSWKRRSLIRNTWGQYWRSMACMINLKSSGASILERTEILNRIIEAKRKRRKELASLPYKEKIQILIQLQKFAEGVKKPGKKRKSGAWSIWFWTRLRPDNLLGKISKGKLAEYIGESYSAIPSFLRTYGYDENEDYSFVYRTAWCWFIMNRHGLWMGFLWFDGKKQQQYYIFAFML